MSADNDAIEGVLRRFADLINMGDFESWLALWDLEGRQMPPEAPVRVGLEAIREGMRPAFEDLDLDFDLVSIDESQVHGDFGLTRCTYSLRATPKSGGHTFDIMKDGKALTLYGRQSDGSWKIIFDCFNSNLS